MCKRQHFTSSKTRLRNKKKTHFICIWCVVIEHSAAKSCTTCILTMNLLQYSTCRVEIISHKIPALTSKDSFTHYNRLNVGLYRKIKSFA